MEWLLTLVLLKGNNMKCVKISGVPYVMLTIGGILIMENNFTMNNEVKGNPIVNYRKCIFCR